MGLTALGIPAYMLTSTTSKEDEKFIHRALEKGEENLKILYVTPEKISKSKRFMSKLEKCHHAGRLSLISIDVSICLVSAWSSDLFWSMHIGSVFLLIVNSGWFGDWYSMCQTNSHPTFLSMFLMDLITDTRGSSIF